MSKATDCLILVDVETTGLDPDHGVIIELGIGLYSPSLEVIDTFSSYVFGYREYEYFANWWAPTNTAYRMHLTSGLVKELSEFDGPQEELESGEVEFKAIRFLHRNGIHQGDFQPLCGSSVQFDRLWLSKNMPNLMNMFSYRNIDISTFLEYAKKFAPALYTYVQQHRADKKKHRVLSDIQDSVDLLRIIQEKGIIAR